MFTPRNAEWVAAFLEGEGHFRFQVNPRRGGGTLVATADQKQRWPLDKLVLHVGGSIYSYKARNRGIFVWQLRGKPAAGLMMTLYGLMSPRRKDQIAVALSQWKKLGRYNGDKTHCKRGHEFTSENTIPFLHKGKPARRCRACDVAVHSKEARRLRLIERGGST